MEISNLLDAAGLMFGRERELLEGIARLGRATADGALVWQGTNAQLAEELACSERTLTRVWSAVRALALPWLDVRAMKSVGLVVYITPTTNRQVDANKAPTSSQLTANKPPSNRQVDANKAPTNGQVTATRARVQYEKILPTEVLKAGKATREDAHDPSPALPLPVLSGLAGWLMGELTRRSTALVQRPTHKPSAPAVESAAAALLTTLGGEEPARRYCEAKLLGYEERPTGQRPGTMERLLAWLLADSTRAATAGSAEAAPARTTAQSYVSEGFDADLAAAVAHGTRNTDADRETDAAWEAHLYREQCLAAFKDAKYFGEIPKDTPYSDEAMTRYGLWPARATSKEAMR